MRLYGSHACGEASPRSDIDLCVVAPAIPDSDGAVLWMEFLPHVRDERYGMCIFELLPLRMKMAVIEEGIVLRSRDNLALYEYFHLFRREWDDRKHWQTIGWEEMRSMTRALKRDRASRGAKGS